MKGSDITLTLFIFLIFIGLFLFNIFVTGMKDIKIIGLNIDVILLLCLLHLNLIDPSENFTYCIQNMQTDLWDTY